MATEVNTYFEAAGPYKKAALAVAYAMGTHPEGRNFQACPIPGRDGFFCVSWDVTEEARD